MNLPCIYLTLRCICLIFDAEFPFKNVYAAAEKDYFWGIIDKEGNWVVPPTYHEIGVVHIIK